MTEAVAEDDPRVKVDWANAQAVAKTTDEPVIDRRRWTEQEPALLGLQCHEPSGLITCRRKPQSSVGHRNHLLSSGRSDPTIKQYRTPARLLAEDLEVAAEVKELDRAVIRRFHVE